MQPLAELLAPDGCQRSAFSHSIPSGSSRSSSACSSGASATPLFRQAGLPAPGELVSYSPGRQTSKTQLMVPTDQLPLSTAKPSTRCSWIRALANGANPALPDEAWMAFLQQAQHRKPTPISARGLKSFPQGSGPHCHPQDTEHELSQGCSCCPLIHPAVLLCFPSL